MTARGRSAPRRATLLLAALCAAGCESAGTPPGGELDALVAEMLPALAPLAGLDVREPIRTATRSAAQVRAFVEHRLREDYPAEVVAGVHAAYGALGLVPDSLDFGRLITDLYSEQIVGYYDPDSTTLYIVEGVSGPALRQVLAHELVHALQDQHVNLDSLIAPGNGNDRQLAALAAIEGHATLVMLAFLAGQGGTPVDPASLPDPAPGIRAGMSGANAFPVFRSAPEIIREVLVFPYAEGAQFAWTEWAKAQPRPAFTNVLPESTEQVLDPARFRLPDPPTEVRFEAAPGAGVYENTFGAFEVGAFLRIRGATTGATGWDGDRYRVLPGSDGAVLEWHSVWDDAATADAFAAAVSGIFGSDAVERYDAGRPAVSVRVGDGAAPQGRMSCPSGGAACTVR